MKNANFSSTRLPYDQAKTLDRATRTRHPRPITKAFLVTIFLLAPSALLAGNHVETTWLPAPSAVVKPGRSELRLKLPYDRFGPVRQALFLRARVIPATTQPATQPASAPVDPNAPVVLRLSSDGKQLPDWKLDTTYSGYIINVATIDANPGKPHGELWLDAELLAPGPLPMVVLGCPDVLAQSTDFDGPFDAFIDSIPPGERADYFRGLRLHMLGKLDDAAAHFLGLRNAKDEAIGRFARRGLRMLAYQKRPRPAPDDYVTGRATIMYLQQCGFFGQAWMERRSIGRIERDAADAWFRIAEVAERMGEPLSEIAKYCDLAGRSSGITNPVEWRTLLLILHEEEVNGQKVRLTSQQVRRIDEEWRAIEKMVYGASLGFMKIKTDVAYITDASVQSYEPRLSGYILSPTDDLFPVSGSYDSVISIRPGGPSVTVGPDVGPNGAALTDLGPDRGWQVLLHEWNHQFDWATQATECGPGYPVTHDSDGCGTRPIPSMGYGHRASMRYYMTPAMYRKTLIGMPESPGTYIRRWQVEGPYEVASTIGPDGMPDKHVLDPFPPASVSAVEPVIVESEDDFVDLRGALGDVKWGVAKASSWVYSPRDQYVPMWLGHNDGMAVWINRQCVHRGHYYAIARWEDADVLDMVMSHAWLRRGWNRVEAVIESWPAPRDGGWGFSLRFADWDNNPLIGLAYLTHDPPAEDIVPDYKPPAVGLYYDWNDIAATYHDETPQLSNADLAAIASVPGLEVRGAIQNINGAADKGHVAIGVPGAAVSRIYRLLPDQWNTQTDVDWVLNNVMDWSREEVAVFPFQREGRTHVLLFLRPEAIKPYLELLREHPAASQIFAGRTPAQRVLGYVVIPPGSSARTLLVVEACIGEPDDWPIDQEDLLRLPMPPPATMPAATTGPATAPGGR